MANDDFLKDVQQAVQEQQQGVSNVFTPDPVTTVVKDQAAPQDSKMRENVENTLLNTLEGSSGVKKDDTTQPAKRETLSLPKDKAKETDKQKEQNLSTTQKDQKDADTTEKKGYNPLDVFLQDDDNGNLVLNGEVLFPKGKARTHFENVKREGRNAREAAHKQAVANVALAEKFKELYTEHEALLNEDKVNSLQTELKMDDKQYSTAVSLLKTYQTNPLQAVKTLLTQMRMNGIDLSSLGINGGVDPASMQKIIADAVAEAVKEKQPQQRSQQDEVATVTQEAKQFLQKYPDARNYTDIVAKAKERYPEASFERIWLELVPRLQAADEARSKQEALGTGKTQQQQNNGQQRQPRPMTSVVTNNKLQQSPPRDYSKMSFEEIAASLKEDIN